MKNFRVYFDSLEETQESFIGDFDSLDEAKELLVKESKDWLSIRRIRYSFIYDNRQRKKHILIV
jgi:hypothetical protein